MNPLHIAQIAPLAEAVPPKLYGGTERVVSYLTEELVGRGHHVTLFASGDSHTRAELVPGSPEALRLAGIDDATAHHLVMAEGAMARIDDFDVVHAHLDYLFFPYARRTAAPTVTTLHGRLDRPESQRIYGEFDDVALVSISHAQRTPVPRARWAANVHHGLPDDLYRLDEEPEDYLAFIGRVSPEKRVDSAIRAAIAADIPVKIAAKIDDADRAYYRETLAPLVEHPLVDFVGEIGEADKQAFLGKARALLFLIDWPEPFGLAMIEAMACGTPTIARRRGAVPEVIDEGVSGFVCETEEEATRAIGRALTLDRAGVRAAFERRFTVERMADDYLALYRRLIGESADARTGRFSASVAE